MISVRKGSQSNNISRRVVNPCVRPSPPTKRKRKGVVGRSSLPTYHIYIAERGEASYITTKIIHKTKDGGGGNHPERVGKWTDGMDRWLVVRSSNDSDSETVHHYNRRLAKRLATDKTR